MKLSKNSLITSAQIFITYLFIISVVLFLFSTTVHAEELPETENITDSEQNERLNSLEIRLEELGFQINEINGTLEEVQTSELSEQEERLLISEKLDLVIVALNDLINYDIELLTKADNSELLEADYRIQVLDNLKLLNDTSIQHFDSTVSGNNLISQLDQNLLQMDENMTISNEENQADAEEYITYILLFVGIAIGCIIGSIFSRYLKHE